MDDLAILVPSRGRPHNMKRLADAVARTGRTGPMIYCRLDDDDPTAESYPDVPDVLYSVGPRIRFGASVNELAAEAVANGVTHLAMFGDDVVPETIGWDRMLIDALGGRLGIAYGSDGLEHLHGPDLPTHFITQAEVFVRLGWLVLPTLRHLYADDVARELGKGLGNFQYVPDAKISHFHRWNKKAPDDLTYQEANDKVRREDDRRAFEAWRDNGGLAEALERLR